MTEQGSQRAVCATGGRIFRHAVHGCEHAGPDIHITGSVRIQQDIWRQSLFLQYLQYIHVEAGPLQGIPVPQLHHQEWQAYTRRLWGMNIHRNIGCHQRQHRRSQICCDSLPQRQALGRGKLTPQPSLFIFADGNRYQSRLFLERNGQSALEISKVFNSRQYKGRPDVGMPSKRNFSGRCKNSNLAGIALFRRKHEGSFRKIEFAGDLLHLPGTKPISPGQNSQLIPSETVPCKDVTCIKSIFHRTSGIPG